MGLLAEQRRLQDEVFGLDPTDLSGEALVAYATFNALAVGREIGEALDHLKGWKWHSHVTPYFDDRAAYVEELGDAVRHLLNLLLIVGATDEDLESVFRQKELTIRAREESGEYVG